VAKSSELQTTAKPFDAPGPFYNAAIRPGTETSVLKGQSHPIPANTRAGFEITLAGVSQILIAATGF
jgi:hypothetical protein